MIKKKPHVFRRRFITIRVSIQEKEILVKKAESLDKDVSTYIREKLELTNKEI
jgi:hypothetical protein